MALAFISNGPTVEVHHGHHLVTFESGSEKIQLLLTRFALGSLIRTCNRASDEAFESDLLTPQTVIPFGRNGGA